MITIEKRGKVAIVMLNNPAKRNAFYHEMYTEFADVLRQFDADDSIAVIVLTGAEGNYCIGNDVSDFLNMTPEQFATAADVAKSPPADAVDAVIRIDTPVVAAVEGMAVGFGATMLLHFDRVVCSESTRLLYPFTNNAVVPEACASLLLPRLVGDLTAKRLMFDPEFLSAQQLFELKLATDVVPEGEALTKALVIAEKMATKSVFALRETKRLMRGDRADLVEQARLEFESFANCLLSDEAQAAFQAIVAKR